MPSVAASGADCGHLRLWPWPPPAPTLAASDLAHWAAVSAAPPPRAERVTRIPVTRTHGPIPRQRTTSVTSPGAGRTVARRSRSRHGLGRDGARPPGGPRRTGAARARRSPGPRRAARGRPAPGPGGLGACDSESPPRPEPAPRPPVRVGPFRFKSLAAAWRARRARRARAAVSACQRFGGRGVGFYSLYSSTASMGRIRWVSITVSL